MVGMTQKHGIAQQGSDRGGDELALAPLDIDFEAATGAQASDRAARPGGGQGGEELHLKMEIREL